MKNGINVLSCFDGLAGGLVALKRAGIKVNRYYAFEIDKYAIKIATKNHPEIVELGDINNWKFFDEIEVPDLIIAGSPCTGFSVAGKGLNFEDPHSKLFFVFVDILNYWRKRNPKVKFLLENVKMKAEWKNIISQYLGVEPVLINSALVSAQNRQRLYWTNWQFPQPEDRGLVLRDILEDSEGTPVIKNRGVYTVKDEKAMCLDANYHKGSDNHGQRTGLIFDGEVRGAALRNQVTKRGVEAQLNVRKDDKSNCVVPSYAHKLNGVAIKRIGTATDINGHDILKRIYSPDGKAPTLDTQGRGNREPKVPAKFYLKEEQLEKVKFQKGAKSIKRKVGTFEYVYKEGAIQFPNSLEGKAQTLVASGQSTSRSTTYIKDEHYYRKLTPLECERLQTLDDNYTEGVSNTQRYRMIGNGWTIEVVRHIFSFLPEEFYSV